MKLDLPAAIVLAVAMVVLFGCIYLKVDGAATALLGLVALVILFFQNKGVSKSIPPPPPSKPVNVLIPQDRPTKPGELE